MGQCNLIEDPEINPQTHHRHLIFDKEAKNGFGEILHVQGQPRLSSKGNLAYPRPIFPKNNTEAKYTGKLSLWFKPYWHLIPLNPFIFKAFSLHPSNLKWPHRKDSSSLQGHLNLLYSLFGAAPDCPHRIIGCASGYPTYSSSIVPGGFEVKSYITRFTPLTSLTILLVTLNNTS